MALTFYCRCGCEGAAHYAPGRMLRAKLGLTPCRGCRGCQRYEPQPPPGEEIQAERIRA